MLAVVDAARVVARDPLRPAVQVQRSALLVSGPSGIAHEPQVCLEAETHERADETLHPRREAPGARVRVGSLEREDVELHLQLRRRQPLIAICFGLIGSRRGMRIESTPSLNEASSRSASASEGRVKLRVKEP